MEIQSTRLVSLNYVKFDEPFKIPGKAGFVVPILVGDGSEVQERNYRLLQEVEDRVKVEDMGHVTPIRFTNKSGTHVFVRKGTILEGVGQPRSPVSSVVLEPDEIPVEVPVNCVFMSRPTREGADFHTAGLSPHSIYLALGDQGQTWADVSRYHGRVRAQYAAGPMATAALNAFSDVRYDDLAGTVRAIDQLKDDVDEALAKLPDHVRQVGLAVFSLRGLEGVELFNSPDSWRALSDSIVKSYKEIWEDESDLVSINTDAAHFILNKFWGKLVEDAKLTLRASTRTNETYGIEMDEYAGEAVFIGGVNIHLAVTRCEKQERRDPFYTRDERLQTMRGGSWGVPRSTPSWQQYTGPVFSPKEGTPDPRTVVPPVQLTGLRKGAVLIMQHLNSEGASKFNDLAREAYVSRPTLTKRLRELTAQGFVEYTPGENGKAAYILTPRGKVVAKVVKEE